MKQFLRKFLKLLLARMLYYSGISWLYDQVIAQFVSSESILILMYHRVILNNDPERDYLQAGLYVTENTFFRQMQYISKKYRIMQLSEVVTLVRGGKRLPRKCAVITFDDGWKDNYTVAFPILRQYNIPATIFLTLDYIGSGKIFWFYQISILLNAEKSHPDISRRFRESLRNFMADLKLSDSIELSKFKDSQEDPDRMIEFLKLLRPDILASLANHLTEEFKLPLETYAYDNMLNWAQILEMKNQNIEFGSHGLSHNILTQLSLQDAKYEIAQSRLCLKEKLDRDIDSFSYPNGNYNEQIKSLVKSAGYLCALTTERNMKINGDDLFSLGRIGIHEGKSVGIFGKFSQALFAFNLSKISNYLRAIT